MNLKALFSIRDSQFNVGDPYDLHGITGKIVAINPKSNTLTVETMNEEGDVENIEVSSIKDSSETDRLVESLISRTDVLDLYIEGTLSIQIPSSVITVPSSINSFVESCKERIYELWDDSEVNFDFGEADFTFEVVDNLLIITLK